MSAVFIFKLYIVELILRGELDLDDELDNDEESEDEGEYAIVVHQELGCEEKEAFKNNPDVDKDSGSSEEGKAPTSDSAQLAQAKPRNDEAYTGDKRHRQQQQQTQQPLSYCDIGDSNDADDEADSDTPPKRRRRASFPYIRR